MKGTQGVGELGQNLSLGSRWFSRPFGIAGTVSAQGRGVAGGGDMVAGRVANVGKQARGRVGTRA